MTNVDRTPAGDMFAYQLEIFSSAVELDDADVDESNLWYVNRRRAALGLESLVAAPVKKFNPNLHPRGRDGKFISVQGLVRFLRNGKWTTAKVIDINGNDGGVTVEFKDKPNDYTMTQKLIKFPSKVLYSAPKPKATLNLPDITKDEDKGFVKVGSQAGSNPGGFFKVGSAGVEQPKLDDPLESDDKLYVKKSKSTNHASVEVLANDLYRLAGVAVPDVFIAPDSGTVGSKVTPGERKKLLEATDDQLSQIRANLVIDAWLANWDVVGLEYDNIVITDGIPYRIDAGGALIYRAQGGVKGSLFGSSPTELASLRDPKINSQAAKIFGSTTDEELADGAKRLAAIRPSTIKEFVENSGVEDPDALTSKLLARRKAILEELNVTDPYADSVPDIQKAVAEAATAKASTTPIEEKAEKLAVAAAKSVDDKLNLSPPESYVAKKPTAETFEKLPASKFPIHGRFQIVQEVTDVSQLKEDQLVLNVPAGYLKTPYGQHDSWSGPVMGTTAKTSGGHFLITAVSGYMGPKTQALSNSYHGADRLFIIKDTMYPDGYPEGAVRPSDLEPGRLTLKADGSLLYKGVVIGSHGNSWSSRHATINAEFSPTGLPIKVRGYNVQALKERIYAAAIVEDQKVDLDALSGFSPQSLEVVTPHPAVSVVKANATSSQVRVGDYVLLQDSDTAPIIGRVQASSSDLEGKTLKEIFDAAYLSDGGVTVGVAPLSDLQNGEKVGVVQPIISNGSGNLDSKLEIAILDDTNEEMYSPDSVSMKADGTIIMKGQVIGTHKLRVTSGYYDDFVATIFPAFSPTGKTLQLVTRDKPKLRLDIMSFALVGDKPGPSNLAGKKTIAKTLKAATLEPSGAKIGTTDVVMGLTVRHKSGAEGVVAGWPNQEKYPGILYVDLGDGGKKKQYNVSGLEVVIKATAPGSEPEYATVKTADNKIPKPGQKIKTGKAGLVGVLLKVNPKNGYVTVQLEDGSKKTTTLATTYVLADVDESLSASSGIIAVAKKTPVKLPHVGADLSKLISPLPMQDDDSKEKFINKGKRKLMADGSVPYVGMYVKDKKGNAYIIAEIPGKWEKAASSIKVVPVDADDYFAIKPVSRQVSSLSVDVERENSKGAALKRLNIYTSDYNGHGSVITIDQDKAPPGSLVFYQKPVSRSGLGFVKIITPDGRLLLPQSGGANVYERKLDKNELSLIIADTSMELLGYMEADSSLDLVTTQGYKSNPASNAEVVPGASFTYDHESVQKAGSLSKLISEYVAKKQEEAGTNLPQFAPVGSPLIPPPKPKDLTDAPKIEFPQPTGSGETMNAKPEIQGASSVIDALSRVIENKDKQEEGTAVGFALFDSDQIGDQQVRFQVVKGPDGKEYIEARVKLMPDSADAIGQKIVSSDDKTGGWDFAPTSVEDLADGTLISVRQGTTNDVQVLKPDQAYQPNARIVGEGVLITEGEPDGSIVPKYRFTVMFQDGTTGEVDIEKRPGSSVKTFVYNWEKIVPGTSLSLTSDAEQEGWSRLGHLGQFPIEGTDDTGKKVYSSFTTLTSSVSYGSTLSRTMPDGTLIRFNYVHPTESETDGYSKPRWNTRNNEITISVPLDGDADPQKSVSDALEVLGVSDVNQRPPTKAEMREMAIRKLAWQFDATWSAGKDYGVTGDANNPQTVELFKKIGAAIGLGRPLNFDDFVVYTDKEGRSFLGLSDEVVAKVTKKQGRTFYEHSVSGGASRIIDILSGTNSGLLSTDERWSRGVLTHGQSSGTDDKSGSGDRVYFHTRTNTSVSGYYFSVIVSAKSLNRTLDSYTSSGDGWGTKHRSWLEPGNAHETMYKGKVPPEMIAYVVVSSHSARKDIIEAVKARGVTEIGGRKIEDIIIGESVTADEQFQSLGSGAVTVTPFSEIPE